jgi:hypothetical protein
MTRSGAEERMRMMDELRRAMKEEEEEVARKRNALLDVVRDLQATVGLLDDTLFGRRVPVGYTREEAAKHDLEDLRTELGWVQEMILE